MRVARSIGTAFLDGKSCPLCHGWFHSYADTAAKAKKATNSKVIRHLKARHAGAVAQAVERAELRRSVDELIKRAAPNAN
jgi:hypothetical protein